MGRGGRSLRGGAGGRLTLDTDRDFLLPLINDLGGRFMAKFVGALAALMLCASPVLAAGAMMTAEEKVATDQALSRGQLIYRLDKAAWVATDAMLAQLKKNEIADVRGGWIVETNGDTDTVTFLGLNGEKLQGVFVAEVKDGKVTRTRKIAAADRTDLTPAQLRLAKATNTARVGATNAKFLLCAAKPFNTVVVPPASEADAIDVYLLTPQTKTGVIPFGGHHKVTVSADGSAKARPYTRSCLDMGAPPSTKGTPVGLTVSHLLDPTPTEIHVFSSLAAKLPVYVATTSNGAGWAIENGAIRKLDLKASAPPAPPKQP